MRFKCTCNKWWQCSKHRNIVYRKWQMSINKFFRTLNDNINPYLIFYSKVTQNKKWAAIHFFLFFSVKPSTRWSCWTRTLMATRSPSMQSRSKMRYWHCSWIGLKWTAPLPESSSVTSRLSKRPCRPTTAHSSSLCRRQSEPSLDSQRSVFGQRAVVVQG